MAWWTTHKKAVAGFLGALVGLGGALLSLGVLSGALSHDLAVALAAATPILSALGVAVAPANIPTQQAAIDIVATVEKMRQDWAAICAAVAADPAPPPPP